MRELAIIGCWIGGSLLGAGIGAWMGFQEDAGADFPMAPAFYAPLGCVVGGAAGVVAGAVLFA